MKIDPDEMKIDGEDDEKKNEEDLDIYDLEIYTALESLAEKESQGKVFQNS